MYVVVDTWLRPPPHASVCSPLTIAPASTNPCAASIGPSASVRLNVSPGLTSVPLILLAPFVMFTVRRGSLVSGVSNSETISLIPSASSAAVDCDGSACVSSTVADGCRTTAAVETAAATAFGSSVVPGVPGTITGASFTNSKCASADALQQPRQLRERRRP